MGRSLDCWRCQLSDLLNTLLAGPEDTIPSHIQPLAAALLGMPRPQSGYAWIRRNLRAQQLLRALATKDLDLDHAALDGLPPSRTVEYVRGLLVEHCCLPPRDPHLTTFEQWLARKLAQVTDPEHRQIIDQFARWHLLRRLRRLATAGPVSTTAFLNAKQSTTVGIQFLAWLAGRGQVLQTATQQDIDAWFAGGPSTRKHAARLISWAGEQRVLRSIELPARRDGHSPGMGPQERLDHLRRVLRTDELHVVQRVIATLVLLFGQPLSKIVRLRRDAITIDADHVGLTLGSDALLLPDPVAELITTFLADSRYRRNTAANHDSPWLFPGTQPGRPLHIYRASRMLKEAGIPAGAARAGTWLELVRDAPPSVLAEALGIHPNTAMRYAALAGADYLAYPRTVDRRGSP